MILRGQVFSRALEMETPIAMMTPDNLDGEQPYKVAYLLHGTCGRGEDFLTHTLLPVYGQAYRCVFVMPDVQRSLYTDMAWGQRYFEYVAEELPAICNDLLRISAVREDSFVIGLSSGGYGALKCALRYPRHYGACCAISPGALEVEAFMGLVEGNGLTPALREGVGEGIIRDFRSAFGQDPQRWGENDLLALARQVPAQDSPRMLVQMGTGDGMLEICRRFAGAMQTLPLDFAYEEGEGGHDFSYFDKALRRALAFCMPTEGR